MNATTDTTTTVATVRKHYAAARTMRRNLRLHRYQGRNSGGDYAWRENAGHELLRSLPRELQGLLTSEHKLAQRVSYARDAGQERPELRARLAADRRHIKELLS